MADIIDNDDDVINSRNVVDRIDELVEEAAEYGDLDDDDRAELDALRKLAEQGETLSDWNSGTTLIRESFFTDYVKEYAEDIGAIDNNASWPANHIDWDAAADELKIDYTAVEFDGITYYARS